MAMRMTMKCWGMNTPIPMTMGTTCIRTRVWHQGNIATGTTMRHCIMCTHMCRMRITCTSIELLTYGVPMKKYAFTGPLLDCPSPM